MQLGTHQHHSTVAESSPGSPPRRVGRVEEYEIDGEIVLYDPKRNRTHVLNPTAAVVWRLCDGSRHFQQLADDMAALFDEDPQVIKQDLSRVLEELGRAHLLRHAV